MAVPELLACTVQKILALFRKRLFFRSFVLCRLLRVLLLRVRFFFFLGAPSKFFHFLLYSFSILAAKHSKHIKVQPNLLLVKSKSTEAKKLAQTSFWRGKKTIGPKKVERINRFVFYFSHISFVKGKKSIQFTESQFITIFCSALWRFELLVANVYPHSVEFFDLFENQAGYLELCACLNCYSYIVQCSVY